MSNDAGPVGVIVETPLLGRGGKIRACRLVTESGVKSVITCTGSGGGGATAEYVKLLREIVGARFEGAAAAGIHDPQTAPGLIEAGTTRMGTKEGLAMVRGSRG